MSQPNAKTQSQGSDFQTVQCGACGYVQNSFSFVKDGQEKAICAKCGSVGGLQEFTQEMAKKPTRTF